ncbi:hypothetical protein BJ166DRAFT_511863 [Pestalotiopsis sp. NC0098]|nr:hypothetical protein BJ166DRAFT_511863 [Pestalotiopsis sp. NC0098]
MSSTTTIQAVTPASSATSNTSGFAGKFRYVNKNKKLVTNPNLYHLPPLSDFNDPVTLPVTDIRPSLAQGDASSFKLASHGFTARREPSELHSAPHKVESWYHAELIKSVYMPEVEAMIKRITGCKTAIVESAVLRNNVHTEVDSHSKEHSGADFKADEAGPCPRMIGFSNAGGASPAPKVHLDFSPLGARQHIRKYHRVLALATEQVIEAENKLLKSGVRWEELKLHYGNEDEAETGIPRFALFSVWRSLKTVRRDPLAVASCATFPTSDYVAVDLVQPSGRFIPPHLSQIIDPENPQAGGSGDDNAEDEAPTHLSNSYLAYEPSGGNSHDWHFISNQEPEDVLIIQLFDNEMEALEAAKQENKSEPSVGGVIHSAFELQGQDDSAEARESLEVRVVAIW